MPMLEKPVPALTSGPVSPAILFAEIFEIISHAYAC